MAKAALTEEIAMEEPPAEWDVESGEILDMLFPAQDRDFHEQLWNYS